MDREEKTKKSYNQTESEVPPEPPYDSSLANKALDSNYMKLNRELFYVQELLNSNTSWELEHKITNGTNMKLRGIFTEDDISFQIAHTFGTGGMNDTLVGKGLTAVKNTVEGIQAWAPLTNSVDRVGHIIGDTATRFSEKFEEGSWAGDALKVIGEAVSDGGDSISGFMNKGRDLLKGMSINTVMNGKFLAATDLIKTYQGTDAKFSLPDLKCWIFHNSQDIGDKGRNVLDMVKAITSTCMGDLTDVEGVIGLQHAPGNYQPDIQVLNKSYYDKGMGMKGTWNLTMGGYTIYNLLVTNVEVTLSKFNAIDYNGNDSGDPLYAELKLSIEPASYISRADIFNTIMNKRSTQNKITYRKYGKVSDSNKSSDSGKKKSGKNSGTSILSNMDESYRSQINDVINNENWTVVAKSTKILELCQYQAGTEWLRSRGKYQLDPDEVTEFEKYKKEQGLKYYKEVTKSGYGKCKSIFN